MKSKLLLLILIASLFIGAYQVNQVVNGNMTVTGEFDTGNPFAWAYVSVSDTTVCSTAGTYYPIQGMFVNIGSDFGACCNGIIYNGVKSRYLFISSAISASSSINNTNLTYAIAQNDTIVSGSEMPRLLEIGKTGCWPCLALVSITPGDTLSLVFKSDQAGAAITTRNLQTFALAKP